MRWNTCCCWIVAITGMACSTADGGRSGSEGASANGGASSGGATSGAITGSPGSVSSSLGSSLSASTSLPAASSSEPGTDAGAGPDAGLDAGAAPIPDFLDAVEPRIVGTYAMRMQVATVQTVPVFGAQASLQVALGRATVTRSGDHFVIEEAGCHVMPQTGGTVSTVIDDAVPRSAAPLQVRVDVHETDGGVGWTRARSVATVGVELANPGTDVLPVNGTDPRIRDQDGDSHPGVTAHISGFASGDVYVVQRQRFRASGTLVADGELRGLVEDTSEQSTVGASTVLLNRQIPSVPDSDPSRSNVRLRRVTPAYDCDRIVAEVGTLFP